MISTKAFKAYDIRGIVPSEVNEDLAYRLGRALAWKLQAKELVVGHDIRLSGPALSEAAVKGMRDAGANVQDLGQCGTEMIYFATAHLKTDGGMMITASHNPKDYNGMKLVRSEARPISADTGLKDLAELVAAEDFETRVPKAAEQGSYKKVDIVPSYVDHLLSYINVKSLLPLKIVANPGNGGAGPIVKELAKHLPCQFIMINDTPDGTFPNGVPNPLLPENRAATSEAVKRTGPTWGSPGMGTSTGASSLTKTAGSSKGIIWWGSLPSTSSRSIPAARSFTIPGSPGTRKTSLPGTTASRYGARAATPSSRNACAGRVCCTGAK